MTVVADYDKFLHVLANRMLGWPGHPLHEDLVQEGRIAIWRAEQTYDPTKGALPSWVTRAAEMRMKDIAWGTGQPFGREATRGKREVKTTLLEDISPVIQEEIEPRTKDIAEHAMWAYHHGELHRTIERLTPRQQEAVRAKLAGGVLTPQERAAWVKARVHLQQELEHLQEVIDSRYGLG